MALDLQQRQGGSTVWLLREFRIDAPGRDRGLDAMFKDLAAASGTTLVARIAAPCSMSRAMSRADTA